MDKSTLEELRKLSLSGYGRANANRIVDAISQKPDLYKDLFTLFLADEEPVSRRVVWGLDLYAEIHPEVLLPYLDSIVDHLPGFRHDALKRHSLRMLARSPLPGNNLGQLISYCFDVLISPTDPPAVKVHAMEILYRAAQNEPDLKKELIDTIEWRLAESSAGIRSRGEKILKKLYSERVSRLLGS
jgi:hypothetical protein